MQSRFTTRPTLKPRHFPVCTRHAGTHIPNIICAFGYNRNHLYILSIGPKNTAPMTGMDSRAQETVGSSEAPTTHRCNRHGGETCTSSQEDLSVHWRKCYSTLTEYDSKVVSSWTEEMNTTLIFVSASFVSATSGMALTRVS